MQCTVPFRAFTWKTPADLNGLAVTHDLKSAVEPLPTCPECKSLARPNVMMFGDGLYVETINDAQDKRYGEWRKEVKGSEVVIVEVGAGLAVPRVRWESERTARSHNAKLIRINMDDCAIPEGITGVSLPMGGLAALQLLEKELTS